MSSAGPLNLQLDSIVTQWQLLNVVDNTIELVFESLCCSPAEKKPHTCVNLRIGTILKSDAPLEKGSHGEKKDSMRKPHADNCV
jgi:hypothetical protein